jgi:hypothetical protein
MHKIDGSSAISAVEMKGDDLRIHFNSGQAYDYAGVGKAKMTAMINADSPGKYFAQEIRPNCEGVRCTDDEMEVTSDDATGE